MHDTLYYTKHDITPHTQHIVSHPNAPLQTIPYSTCTTLSSVARALAPAPPLRKHAESQENGGQTSSRA